MRHFKDVNDINQLLNDDDDLGDEAAENSIEALVSFNEDMRILALNSY